MDIGIVGDGPGAAAARAAFADVDATVDAVTADELDGTDLGVVVAPVGDDAFRRANATADRWLAVELGGVGGHALDVDAAVSVFTPESACHDCLRSRVASNLTREANVADADPSAVDAGGEPSAARFAGAVAGRRAVRLLAGDDVAGTVVEVPGPERELLPVPGCACGDPPDPTLELSYHESSLDDALARAERTIDERVGLVRQVGERESFPLPYYLAQTADTSGFSDVRAAEFTAGADPDWDVAFMKALGEGLERYSAGVYRSNAFTTAPASNLATAVPPSRFVRPDSYRPPEGEEAIPWVQGRDLVSGADVALPAEFVHFPPPVDRHKPPITTGLGLGSSTVDAVLSGLYEVIERDATMLSWYSSFEPLGLEIGSVQTDDSETTSAVDRFRTLVRRARAEYLTVTPLLVTQDVDVPVVAAAVHRQDEWPRFAVGSGADLDPVAAAVSALAEALQNWVELRAMGPEQATAEEGAIGEYADFPREAAAFVDPDGTIPASSLGGDHVSGETELRTVLGRVADAGLDAYAARVTPRDVAGVGFEAVRVSIPEAQPLFTDEPFFGDRAQSVPASMGFEADLDRRYHPYP